MKNRRKLIIPLLGIWVLVMLAAAGVASTPTAEAEPPAIPGFAPNVSLINNDFCFSPNAILKTIFYNDGRGELAELPLTISVITTTPAIIAVTRVTTDVFLIEELTTYRSVVSIQCLTGGTGVLQVRVKDANGNENAQEVYITVNPPSQFRFDCPDEILYGVTPIENRVSVSCIARSNTDTEPIPEMPDDFIYISPVYDVYAFTEFQSETVLPYGFIQLCFNLATLVGINRDDVVVGHRIGLPREWQKPLEFPDELDCVIIDKPGDVVLLVPAPDAPPAAPPTGLCRATVQGALRLFSQRDFNSTALALVPFGTELTVSVSGDWAQATFNGQTGFLPVEFLKLNCTNPTPTPTPTPNP